MFIRHSLYTLGGFLYTIALAFLIDNNKKCCYSSSYSLFRLNPNSVCHSLRLLNLCLLVLTVNLTVLCYICLVSKYITVCPGSSYLNLYNELLPNWGNYFLDTRYDGHMVKKNNNMKFFPHLI